MKQRKSWWYKGVFVMPADRNSSDIVWTASAHDGEGKLRSDTKDGMKQLINRKSHNNPSKRRYRRNSKRLPSHMVRVYKPKLGMWVTEDRDPYKTRRMSKKKLAVHRAKHWSFNPKHRYAKRRSKASRRKR